jgi:hypothetical protein
VPRGDTIYELPRGNAVSDLEYQLLDRTQRIEDYFERARKPAGRVCDAAQPVPTNMIFLARTEKRVTLRDHQRAQFQGPEWNAASPRFLPPTWLATAV